MTLITVDWRTPAGKRLRTAVHFQWHWLARLYRRTIWATAYWPFGDTPLRVKTTRF